MPSPADHTFRHVHGLRARTDARMHACSARGDGGLAVPVHGTSFFVEVLKASMSLAVRILQSSTATSSVTFLWIIWLMLPPEFGTLQC